MVLGHGHEASRPRNETTTVVVCRRKSNINVLGFKHVIVNSYVVTLLQAY